MHFVARSVQPSKAPPAEVVIDALRDTKIVRDAVAASAAQVLAQRKTLAAELSKIEGDTTAWEKYTAEIDAARNEVNELNQKLRDAQERLGRAAQARSDSGFSIARRRDEIAATLRETASPLIADFIREMCEAFHETRNSPILSEVASEKSLITGKRHQEPARSNAAAVIIRMHCIRRAIEDAEALMLAPDQTIVAAELDRLRSALPSTGSVGPAPRLGTNALFSDLSNGMPIDEAIKVHCK